MGEPTTGPASCAYKHLAREEASDRFGNPTCKVVFSEPCHPALRGQSGETRGGPPQKPQKLAIGRP